MMGEHDIQESLTQPVHEQIKLARLKKGLSLGEMARLLNCAKSRVWNIEQGKSVPSQELLDMYARILDVRFDHVAFPSLRSHRGADPLKAAGINGISMGISTGMLYEEIVNCRKRAWLLDSWFGLSVEILKPALLTCQAEDIRVLLLDPKPPFAEQRSIDLDMPIEFAPAQIRKNAKVINSCREHLKNRLELRYYYSLPSVPILIFDERAYIGYYFHKVFAHDSPWLAISLRNNQQQITRFGEQIENEFCRLWETASSSSLIDSPRFSPTMTPQ